jgi:hypothetical protein
MGSQEELLADRCQRTWRAWQPARAELERRVCDIVAPPSRPCWFDIDFDAETKTLVVEFTDRHLSVTKRMRQQLYRLGIDTVMLMERNGKRSWRKPE